MRIKKRMKFWISLYIAFDALLGGFTLRVLGVLFDVLVSVTEHAWRGLSVGVPLWAIVATLVGGVAATAIVVAVLKRLPVRSSAVAPIAQEPRPSFPQTMMLGGAEVRWENSFTRSGIDFLRVEVRCPDCKMNLANIDTGGFARGFARSIYTPSCIRCHRQFLECPDNSIDIKNHIAGYLRRLGHIS